MEVDELPLKLEVIRFLLIYLGIGGQIVVALVAQAYNAVVIYRMKGLAVEDSIAESIKTLSVLAQLLDLHGGLRLFVEVAFEFGQFLVAGLPYEIA